MRMILLIVASCMLIASCKTTDMEGAAFAQHNRFQLSKPIIHVDSVFFQNSAKVELELNHPTVELRYAFAKDELNSGSKKYLEPLIVNSSQKLHVKATHADFLDSESLALELVKVQDVLKATELSLQTQAKAPYAGRGVESLLDLKKGSLQFREGHWLGFQSDTVMIGLNFEHEKNIKSIGFSFLKDNPSWIFLPKAIEIWIAGKQVIRKELPAPSQGENPSLELERLTLATAKTAQLSIKIINWSSIPDWHPGKGLKPWLFLDEVFFD